MTHTPTDLDALEAMIAYDTVSLPAVVQQLITELRAARIQIDAMTETLRQTGEENERLRAAAAPSLAQAALDILTERERQKSVEGWTLEHDDAHFEGEMALAAIA